VGLVVDDIDETVRFLSLLGSTAASPASSAATGSVGSSAGERHGRGVMARAPDGSDMFEWFASSGRPTPVTIDTWP